MNQNVKGMRGCLRSPPCASPLGPGASLITFPVINVNYTEAGLIITPKVSTDTDHISAWDAQEKRHKGPRRPGVTHSFVDVFSGAIKFLLHSLFQEVDTELQVKVFFLQVSDLLKKRSVI